jgi:hypothetical protein
VAGSQREIVFQRGGGINAIQVLPVQLNQAYPRRMLARRQRWQGIRRENQGDHHHPRQAEG